MQRRHVDFATNHFDYVLFCYCSHIDDVSLLNSSHIDDMYQNATVMVIQCIILIHILLVLVWETNT